MMTSRLATITLAALVAFGTARAAEAQLGGLIKKKVTEAVKGPDKTAEPRKTEVDKKGFVNGNSDVLEITPPVFEGFKRGLKVEIALRKEFAAELAKYPTREQYQECQGKVAMSEEAQKVLAQMELPETATAEQRQRAMEKFATDLAALVKKSCPLDPSEAPDKGKRLAEIQEKAAAAAGPEVPSGQPDLEGGAIEATEVDQPFGGPHIESLGAVGLTVRQYAILLERIQRFCDELKDAASKNMGGSGGVQIPGTGTNIFWVYTHTEALTLSKDNCQEVYDLIGQML